MVPTWDPSRQQLKNKRSSLDLLNVLNSLLKVSLSIKSLDQEFLILFFLLTICFWAGWTTAKKFVSCSFLLCLRILLHIVKQRMQVQWEASTPICGDFLLARTQQHSVVSVGAAWDNLWHKYCKNATKRILSTISSHRPKPLSWLKSS